MPHEHTNNETGQATEFLGQTPVVIGNVTFWFGFGPHGDPCFHAHMPVERPAWYPLVCFKISESFDGDGWLVSCQHNSSPRPLFLTEHPFLDGLPLPDLLAAVAVLTREKLNPFLLVDRRWHSAQLMDMERLTGLRDALISEAEAALDALPEMEALAPWE